MTVRLSGAVALVSGASSGIGWAVTQRLAAAGSRVLATGRDHEQLARLAESTGAIPLPADLTEPGAAVDLAERALARHGRVDILVNNAGAGWAGRFTSMPESDADTMITVNLRAPIALTRALLPSMCRNGGGHLAFVTSIAGRLAVAQEAVYAATKAGLDAFAQSLQLELPERVRVSVVVPAAVATPFFARRGRPYPRRWPRQLSPARVAEALVTAIARDRAEVYVPGWLRLPVGVRGVLPGFYRRLASRFG